jgi:hypothetical protein
LSVTVTRAPHATKLSAPRTAACCAQLPGAPKTTCDESAPRAYSAFCVNARESESAAAIVAAFGALAGVPDHRSAAISVAAASYESGDVAAAAAVVAAVAAATAGSSPSAAPASSSSAAPVRADASIDVSGVTSAKTTTGSDGCEMIW